MRGTMTSDRRDFLGKGLGLTAASLLSGTTGASETAPVVPGRAYRDAAGQRRLLYSLLGDLPDRERPNRARLRSQE